MLRNIRLLYVHNFLTDFCPQWPYLIIFLAAQTGSYTLGMSVIALENLAAALFDIPTGVFSDRAGRRLTMAAGSLGVALGLSCYAFAPNTAILFVGAIMSGLGQCLFSGTNNALLFETLQSQHLEGEYHHYRGATGSMFQLALCLSAFFAMWLSRYGLKTIFIVGIIPQVLAIAVSFFFVEPPKSVATSAKGLKILKQACVKTWDNPHLFWLVVAKALSYGAGESKFKFQSAFVNALWPIWAVGLYRGLNHALSFVGFRQAGRLIERFGEPSLFIARDVYWFFTQFLAIFFNSFISPVLMLSGSYFFGPGEVASDHLMQKEFTDQERATMGSISSFATSVVFAGVAVALGSLSDHYGVRSALAFGVGVCLLSLPVNVWVFRRRLGLLGKDRAIPDA